MDNTKWEVFLRHSVVCRILFYFILSTCERASALEVMFNVMRSINPRFTYLLKLRVMRRLLYDCVPKSCQAKTTQCSSVRRKDKNATKLMSISSLNVVRFSVIFQVWSHL